MNVAQLQRLKVGSEICMQTQHETLKGTLVDINIARGLLELEQITNLDTNYKYSSAKFYSFHSIKQIEVIECKEKEDKEGEELQQTVSLSCSEDEHKTEDSVEVSQICDTTEESTESTEPTEHLITAQKPQSCLSDSDLLKNLTIILEYNETFKAAVENLLQETEIVLQTLAEHDKILLILGTCIKTYIFDMRKLQYLHSELIPVFTNSYPRKIVHDEQAQSKLLFNYYNIKLEGAIDTQRMYKRIAKTTENASLLEIIEHVLEMHVESLFIPRLADIPTDPKACKLMFAKLAALHLNAFDCMMHKKLFGNFYERCDKFSQTIAAIEDDARALIAMQMNQNYGVHLIDIDNNEWKPASF